MIADKMMIIGSEQRRHAFMETEAVLEQAAEGRKQRPQWARDPGSTTDRGLITRDMCHHVVGSV
jgi:hypothetical protein